MKKIFFSIMAVALAATMCVGVMSCGEDKKEKPEIDYSFHIRGIWKSFPGYAIEFTTNGTYSFENLELGSGSGNFRIFETQPSKVSDYDATLIKLLVSGNNSFDQIWVYHFRVSTGTAHISVEFYANNELLIDNNLGIYAHPLE